MFAVGDILLIDAPIVAHKKYHLCLGTNGGLATLCLYLNSENKFEANIEFEGARFPMIPVSKTGLTVVSLTALPRYTDKQLALFKAKKVGELGKDVAAEIAAHCAKVKTLTRDEKTFVVSVLEAYAAS